MNRTGSGCMPSDTFSFCTAKQILWLLVFWVCIILKCLSSDGARITNFSWPLTLCSSALNDRTYHQAINRGPTSTFGFQKYSRVCRCTSVDERQSNSENLRDFDLPQRPENLVRCSYKMRSMLHRDRTVRETQAFGKVAAVNLLPVMTRGDQKLAYKYVHSLS